MKLVSRNKEIRRKEARKKTMLFIFISAVILVIATLAAILLFTTKKEIKSFEMSPELLRTQDYIEVDKEKDKVVQATDGSKTGVEFDAFFLKDKDGDGIADAIRGTCNQVGSQANLYMELGVQEEGYIKNAVITINSDNFYFNTSIVKDNEISSNYISTNTKSIELNQINNGTEKLLIGSIRSGNYSSSTTKTSAIGNDTSKYSKENSITFSGIFVNAAGEEKEFTKNIPITVDWYGEVNCNITPKTQTQSYTDLGSLRKDDGLHLDFPITTTETLNEVIMYGSYISGTIPELNGYKPTSVEVTGANVSYTYNKETGEFTAQREAVVNENGIIVSNAYSYSSNNTKYNNYQVSIVYPVEAYDEMGEDVSSFELAIPIESVNKGFNNPNEASDFDNPSTSNKAEGIVVTTWRKYIQSTHYNPYFRIYVGTYMGNPYYNYVVSKKKPINIYNGISLEETNDTYSVKWEAYTGTDGKTDGIIIDEGTGKVDNFLDSSNTSISMEEITTNKGISFSGATNCLGNDGWIKVYNSETNELIETFTSKNWSNTYYYKTPVKHIRVETSKTNELSYLTVNNIKQLDDEYITENFTREEFDKLSLIYSYLNGSMKAYTEEGITSTENSYFYKATASNRALYEAPTSVASISIKENTISTQSTAEHEIITINTETAGYNEQGWKNGIYVVQLPSEIIYAKINNVTINNSDVKVLAYDTYVETYDGKENYYIKILTENNNEASYAITVDCDLTPDPRTPKKTGIVALYAINEEACDYYYGSSDIYDIDGDLNKTEQVNYRTTSLTLDPGSTLNTTQTASNYDEDKNATIAPRVAITDKDQRTATISISAMNYYNYNLKDIKIVGVVPFEGNDYVLSGNDLGSEFTAYMSEKGISTITPELKDKVNIYYSTKENPGTELTGDNGWTLAENITDWSKIKNYMIVLDNSYVFSPQKTIEFEYEINIPKGVDYNKVSYSEHAIYFALETEEGLYYTQTGCAKLGFMIAKQYNLEIEKYQEDTQKKLEGITFTINEEGQDTSTIKVTNENGKITIPGLFAEKYYILKEQKTTDDYVLNNQEIRFYTYTTINEDETESLHIAYVNEDGSYTKLEDKFDFVKKTSIQAPSDNKDYTVKIEIEDEVKAKIAITKIDSATNLALKNIKYKLFSKEDLKLIENLGRNINDSDIDKYIENIGKIYTTDKDGQINISGIYLDEEYALREIKATGYYLPQSAIKFKIRNNNGEFVLDYTDNGSTLSKEIIKNNEIPTINLKFKNDKIPTYALQLTKYAKNEKVKDENGIENDKVLENAQYKIYGEGIPEEGKIYTTNENGILTIDGLYEYVEGKYITGEYTLVEIYAPEGYSINTTALKFKAYRDEYGKLQIKILEGADVIRNIDALKTDEITGEEEIIQSADLNIINPESEYPIISIGVEDNQIFSLYKKDKDTNKPIAGAKFIITDLDGNYVTGADGNIVGEWVDTTPEAIAPPELTFASTSNYKWSQRDDGTWESVGNHNIHSSTSTLTSNFELLQSATLKFDWSISSESVSYDYVYYTITNTKTNKVLAGTGETTKIGGTSYGSAYESLKFMEKAVDIPAGSYKIEFIYRKDGSGNTGLDAAFIRNIRLEPKEIETTGYYVVTTDENGNITANLGEGLYKAVEVEAPEGYVLPEKEKDRTSYFGVGTSQAATWDWFNSVKGNGWNYINCVTATKDGGTAACGSFSNYSNEIVAGANNGIDVDNNGEIDKTSQGKNDGLIISYNSNGKCNWVKSFGGSENDSLNKIVQISDGGIAVVGYTSSKTVKLDGQEIPELSRSDDETTLSGKDAVLLKLDSDGNYVWGLRMGGLADDEITSIIETSKNNLVIVGCYYSSTFNFYSYNSKEVKNSITASSNSQDGFIASYSLQTGEYQWSQKLGNGSSEVTDVTETSEKLLVAVNNSIRIYDLNGTYKTNSSTGTKITSLDTMADGTVIAGVNESVSSKRWDASIYKMTVSSSNSISKEKIYTLSGNYDDYVTDVKATSDGGIIFGGWYYSSTIEGDGLEDEFAFEGGNITNPKGYVIKLNQDNSVEYSSMFYGDKYNGVTSVTESKNGNIISGGYFSSSNLSATNFKKEVDEDIEEQEDTNVLINRIGNSEGFVIAEGASGAKVPELQRLEVENQMKRCKITTEVRKHTENGKEVEGGTITGSYLTNTPEIVVYGKDSVERITITPDSTYVVKSVEINDKKVKNLTPDDVMGEEKIEHGYTINDDGTITLEIFKNVTEDIHIVVEFSNTISNIEVNHYLWTAEEGLTTNKVAESEYYSDEVGKKYNTYPNTDIDYEIITNLDYYSKLPNLDELYNQNGVDNLNDLLVKLNLNKDDYYIPENANGEYLSNKTEVINYYYKEKTYKLTVHHYLEGTNTSVPLKGSETGDVVPDEVSEGYKKGEEYETHQGEDNKIDYRIYELVSIPENAKGTIEEDTEITYYYRIKTNSLKIVKVAKEDNSIKLVGTNFSLYKLVCVEHEKGYHNSELIKYKKEDVTCWEKVGEYVTDNNGEIQIDNLKITDEFRLVETKASDGRNNSKGQWKIEFIIGEYDKTDENILEIDQDNIIRVTSIENALKAKTLDGNIIIENEKGADNLPITGGIGSTLYYIIGIITTIIALAILIYNKNK